MFNSGATLTLPDGTCTTPENCIMDFVVNESDNLCECKNTHYYDNGNSSCAQKLDCVTSAD